MTILNSNMVFGKQSYVLKYMAQCAMAGKINKSIGGSNTFQFKPVHQDDLAAAVETALAKINDVKGQRFTVNGNDQATLKQLMALCEKSVGKAEGSTQLAGNMGLSDLVEEFFVGITHDKNMARMAEFMDNTKPNLEEGCPDFHKQMQLNLTQSLNDFYGQTKFKPEDLVCPIFTNYKMVSLD